MLLSRFAQRTFYSVWQPPSCENAQDKSLCLGKLCSAAAADLFKGRSDRSSATLVFGNNRFRIDNDSAKR